MKAFRNSRYFIQVVIIFVGLSIPCWATDNPGNPVLAEVTGSFDRHSRHLPGDFEEEQSAYFASTEIWVRGGVAGTLLLMDYSQTPLMSDRSDDPVVIYHWVHALEDASDQIFFLDVIPDDDRPGIRRLIRLQGSHDRYLSFELDPHGRWILQSVAKESFGLEPGKVSRGLQQEWLELAQFDLDALEYELLAMAEELPSFSPGATAETLREHGKRLLGEGDFAGALQAFQQSLDLEPDPDLEDRAARLRAYLEVRTYLEAQK